MGTASCLQYFLLSVCLYPLKTGLSCFFIENPQLTVLECLSHHPVLKAFPETSAVEGDIMGFGKGIGLRGQAGLCHRGLCLGSLSLRLGSVGTGLTLFGCWA